LRKAVGARTRDVLRQFLLEAVALTISGGVGGILLGVGAALLVGRLSPVPAAITGWSVALAFWVSVGVGVVIGVWPARKAARMQAIMALRYEYPVRDARQVQAPAIGSPQDLTREEQAWRLTR